MSSRAAARHPIAAHGGGDASGAVSRPRSGAEAEAAESRANNASPPPVNLEGIRDKPINASLRTAAACLSWVRPGARRS